jgi:hypothetical protein
MPLSVADRRSRLPHGAQREVAEELKVAESYVSAVVTGDARPKTPKGQKAVRRIQVAIARKLRLPVDEAFPPTEQAKAA